MGVSVESLIAGTRIDSGLRNNRYYSDDQIAEKLTDAYADLRDKMIMRFAFWFKKTFAFALAGGLGGNILSLADEVPDLEQIQGLNLIDSQGNPQTVTMLSSFAERNQFNASYPFAMGNTFNGYVGRKYFADGNDLEILPAANSAGNYKLIYTPQQERLALPITVNFDIDTNDIPAVPATGPLSTVGTGSWRLLNSALNTDVPTDETVDMNLTFASPPANVPFSGAYPISGIGLPPTFGAPHMACNNLVSTTGFTGPAAGTGTYTYTPIGAISELPDVFNPWTKYLRLHASIAIRTGMRQPVGALDAQFQREEKRIVAITKQRSQGVSQAPITSTNYGGGGYGWGNY